MECLPVLLEINAHGLTWQRLASILLLQNLYKFSATSDVFLAETPRKIVWSAPADTHLARNHLTLKKSTICGLFVTTVHLLTLFVLQDNHFQPFNKSVNIPNRMRRIIPNAAIVN